MLLITATDEWRRSHAGGAIGLLEVSGAGSVDGASRLEQRKRETEARLRERYKGFARPDFASLPVMSAYIQYYKRFGKTYHVQLQVESIVLKGKSLPNVSPLVDANFVAEVDTLVLTAGHDVARLESPVTVDVAREGDHMTQMNGESRPIRAGDMIMRDARGVCCSIIYGQDNRSPISPHTAHVLYVDYAPTGVPAQAVEEQLRKIEENVRCVAPHALTEQRRILSA